MYPLFSRCLHVWQPLAWFGELQPQNTCTILPGASRKKYILHLQQPQASPPNPKSSPSSLPVPPALLLLVTIFLIGQRRLSSSCSAQVTPKSLSV